MGKRQARTLYNSYNFLFGKHGTDSLEVRFPTLKKSKYYYYLNIIVLVNEAIEFSLLDLSSIQLELETILVTLVERIGCLKSESKGQDLPSSILTAWNRCQGVFYPDHVAQSTSHPSLVVKANPDKPLTLIISQRAQAQSGLSELLPSVNWNKSINGQLTNVHKTNRVCAIILMISMSNVLNLQFFTVLMGKIVQFV